MRGTTHRWHEPAIAGWIRWLTIFLLVMYVVPGLFSAYRAWVQIRSLDLIVPGRNLASGDTIRVRAVSWARTYVYVDLMLVQGAHVDTLATHEIPRNTNASQDPRWKRDSITLVLTPVMLSRYDSGAAMVRAKAEGGPQWLRTPPPLIRETAVQLIMTR
ncbi:MAG: hypothetical protein QOH22_714 [Gemmatimonadaceae bacterium]|nr:hypothetical protein [Gemmatimonadaceae bacterium]